MAHTKYAHIEAMRAAKAQAEKAKRDLMLHKMILSFASEPAGELLSRAAKREYREEIQRYCARRRQKQLWRSLPKAERERLREDDRKIKYSSRRDFDLFDELEFDGIEQQSGGTIAAVAATVGAIVSGAVCFAHTSNKVSSLAMKGHSVADKLQDTLSQVTSTAAAAETTLSGINNFFKKISDAIKSFVDLVKAVGGAFWKFVVGGLYIALKTIGGAASIVQGFVADLLSRLVPDLSPALEFETGDIEQQSGGLVASVSAMVACLFIPAAMTTNKFQLANLIGKNIGYVPKAVEGFESVFNTVLRLIEEAINGVLRLVGKKGVNLVGAAQHNVLCYCKEVDKIIGGLDCEKPDIGKLNEAKALLVTGYNLKATLQGAQLRRTLEHQLDRLNSKIAPFRGLLEVDGCYRAQPLFVMFGGESAVGKTHLIKAFTTAALLQSGLCTSKDVSQHMFQKGEDRFFNGYSGQLAYIMDDVFQKKAVPGTEECEAMTVIKAVNSWPFPLPFADVESKGRFFFNSRLMVGTTNCENIETELQGIVIEPKAVLRRISHGYWLTLSPEYALTHPDGRTTFDYKKWESVQQQRLAALGDKYTMDEWLACTPWEAWNLSPHSWGGKNNGAPGPSVFSVVKDVSAQLKSRTVAHAANVENIFNWACAFDKAVDIEPQAGPRARSELVLEHPVATWGSQYDFSCDEQDMAHDQVADDSVTELDEGFSWPDNIERPKIPKDWETLNESELRKAHISVVPPSTRWHNLYLREQYAQRGIIQAIIASLRKMLDGPLDLLRFGNTGQKVLGVAALISMAYLAKKALAGIWGLIRGIVGYVRRVIFGEPAEQQSVHQEREHNPKPKDKVYPSARAEMGNPPLDQSSDRVYRNTWKLIADGEAVGQVLMVRGCVGVMPYHFRKHLGVAQEIEMIACSNSTGGLRHKLTGAKFLELESHSIQVCDLMFVDFSKLCLQAHKDLVKHFVTDKDFVGELRKTSSLGVRLDVARMYTYNGKNFVNQVALVSRGLDYESVIRVKGEETHQVWVYNAPTQCGDCGAALTIAEPRYFNGKSILGIHVAGRAMGPTTCGQRQAYAAVLTHELVSKMLSKFRKIAVIEDCFEEELAKQGIGLSEAGEIIEEAGLASGSMAPVGIVDMPVSQSTRTKLKPSGFQGFGDAPVAPAKLGAVVRDGLVIEPMHNAMEKYASPLHISDIPNAKAIMALAMKRHWLLTAHWKNRILTTEEAIFGIPSEKIKALNRSTSAGYPLAIRYTRGKHDIFGDGVEFDLTRAEAKQLIASVDELEELAFNNKRGCNIFTDFLKDELRPLAKVESVATRAISGAPLAYLVLFRKYFGWFGAAGMMNHTECGMAPGINHHKEWGVLAKCLLKPGGGRLDARVFAGDFKAFDASEQPDIHMLCLEHINRWYRVRGGSDKEEQVRNVLFMDLIHSRHLTGVGCMRNVIVQWNKSLPSGHPFTTVINSMYSLFCLTACYVKRTGDYENMWEHAHICTFGDDNVVGVSDTVSEVFNQETVAEDMLDFGLTYTSDRKDGVLRKYETIADITFLKRSFVPAECDSGWCAPLALDSILYRTYYFRNNRTMMRDMEENFREILLELSMHPEELWEKYYPIVWEYCAQENIPIDIVSRDQARVQFFRRDCDWF
jgi:hypothetical protein